MRQPALRFDFKTNDAFGRQSEFVLRRLTVNQEARAARIFSSGVSSGAIAFLANHEEQPEIARAAFEQPLRGSDHGGDDALGVRRPSSPDKVRIFARRKKRRGSVHISRERNQRVSPIPEEGESIGIDGTTLDFARKTGGPSREGVDAGLAQRR